MILLLEIRMHDRSEQVAKLQREVEQLKSNYKMDRMKLSRTIQVFGFFGKLYCICAMFLFWF